MKHIAVTITSLFLLTCTQAVAQHSNKATDKTILVSQDFTEILVKTLVKGTPVKVVRAIPADYTPDVHTYYLKKYWERFARLAQNATAAVTVTSAWPQDPLYPWARRANIRIVHIDAIAPLDGSRAGVPLLDLSEKAGKSPAVWNSPGNTARIADIVASDLKILFPAASAQIQANLNDVKKELFKLRTRFETAFGMADFFEVAALSLNHAYLMEEFGIVVVDSLVKPGAKVTREDLEKFVQKTGANDVHIVLSSRKPNKETADLLTSNGLTCVVLSDLSYDEKKPAQEQFLDFHEHNLEQLLKGLSATQ